MKKIHFLTLSITTLFYSSLVGQTVASINGVGAHDGTMLERQKVKPERQLGIDFHYWGTSFHYAGKVRENLFLGFEVGGIL